MSVCILMIVVLGLCVCFDDCGDKFEVIALDCCVSILMIVGTKYEAILCVYFDNSGQMWVCVYFDDCGDKI